MKRAVRIVVAALALAAVASAASAQVNATGKVKLLRVHDVGTGYGPPADFIDVEVVLWLDTQPGKAFGFQLRNDAQQAARQGMLDLLRDAMANNYTVSIDYIIPPGHQNNFVIIRTWVTK